MSHFPKVHLTDLQALRNTEESEVKVRKVQITLKKLNLFVTVCLLLVTGTIILKPDSGDWTIWCLGLGIALLVVFMSIQVFGVPRYQTHLARDYRGVVQTLKIEGTTLDCLEESLVDSDLLRQVISDKASKDPASFVHLLNEFIEKEDPPGLFITRLANAVSRRLSIFDHREVYFYLSHLSGAPFLHYMIYTNYTGGHYAFKNREQS